MQKIKVVGLRRDLSKVIGLLHGKGAIQFKKFCDARIENDQPMEIFPVISEQLVKLQGIQNTLIPQPHSKPEKMKSLEEIIEECKKIDIDKKLGELQKRLEETSRKEAEFEEAKKILAGLGGPGTRILLRHEKLYALGRISNDKLGLLRNELKEITSEYRLLSKELNKFESLFAIAIDKKFESKVKSVFFGLGLVDKQLPSMSEKFSNIFDSVENEILSLKKERGRIDREIQSMSQKYWNKIMSLKEMLEIEATKAKAPSIFGRTDNLFVFEAWLPKSKLNEISHELKNITTNKIFIEKMEESEEDVAPTLLENPQILSPFEFLVEFLSTPKTHEIDPTLSIAIMLPILYGMMLGDVGYGLVSLLFASYLMKKTKGILNQISKIWAIAAIPSILFGILFDEYFGFTHESILKMVGLGEHTLYPSIGRLENIQLLLLATIFLGAFHIGLGFFLGFVNSLMEGKKKHAAGKLAWIGVEATGILLVAAVFFNAVNQALVPALGGLFGVSVLLIVFAEGPIALAEIPKIAGNMFSYARILALGISSLSIALIINQTLLPNPNSGILFFVMIPIYLLMHSLNIFVGMFESLVQGTRLNYVEFFSKFFEGGGQKFNPFAYVRKYTY
ncbi:MAG: V-type ATP synthase subunit I [Candidatus Micrarchaeota archaeon]|nr:V-type ATP synthase subunit I [Candidatus Micrarchaeota archaeon]